MKKRQILKTDIIQKHFNTNSHFVPYNAIIRMYPYCQKKIPTNSNLHITIKPKFYQFDRIRISIWLEP